MRREPAIARGWQISGAKAPVSEYPALARSNAIGEVIVFAPAIDNFHSLPVAASQMMIAIAMAIRIVPMIDFS